MNPDQLYQNYQSAKQDYASSASALQGEGGYSAQLRQGIMKSLRDNEDLVRQMKAGEEGYYNAPSAARNEYQGIFNPFQRESLVDTQVGQARQGWTVPQELLQQRGGMIEDIVGNMTQGYQQEVGLKQNLAEMAWREYQDAMSRMTSGGGGGGSTKAAKPSDELKQDIIDNLEYWASGIKAKPAEGWTENVLLPALYEYYLPQGISRDEINKMVYQLRVPYEEAGMI